MVVVKATFVGGMVAAQFGGFVAETIFGAMVVVISVVVAVGTVVGIDNFAFDVQFGGRVVDEDLFGGGEEWEEGENEYVKHLAVRNSASSLWQQQADKL